MATVSTNQNINAVTYSAGEDITVTSGAKLTIDAQVAGDVTKIGTNPGSFLCITSGGLEILNNSTTTPLVLTLSAASKDYSFEKNGYFTCRGAAISIGTGSNSSGQTFSLAGAPLNTIPYPSHVEVETGSGTGVYFPWMIVPTAGTTVTWTSAIFSSDKSGNVLFYNKSTRVLSCGDGTNGNLIPSGANVRIPNIYIHSATTSTTPASRTLIDQTPSGIVDCEWVGFSDNIYISNSTFSSARYVHCGIAGQFAHANSNGSIELDHVSVHPDTQQTATAQTFSVSSINGAVSLNKITTCTGGLVTGGRKNSISNLPNLTRLDDCTFARIDGRTANTDDACTLAGISGFTVNNLSAMGGPFEFSDLSDVVLIGTRHADLMGTTQETTLATYSSIFATCYGVKMIGMDNAGVAAPRQYLFNVGVTVSDVQFYNINYDAKSNTATAVLDGGARTQIYNSNISNLRSSYFYQPSSTANLAIAPEVHNCRATSVSTLNFRGGQNGVFNLVPATATATDTVFSAVPNYAYANAIDLGLSASTGNILCGPFAPYSGIVVTGTAQLDQAGGIEIPTSGDTVEIETIFDMKAVTSFQNTAPIWTYTQSSTLSSDTTTAPTNITAEFAVKTPSGSYAAYQTLNATNLAAAIAALSGYDSDVGLNMKIKLTATSTDATRVINQIVMATNIDTGWSAPDSSFTVRGTGLTDITTMYLSADNSTISTFTGSGQWDFAGASYFAQDVYFIRRTSGGDVIYNTVSSPTTLTVGDNGYLDLFVGEEIQLAEVADVSAIKAVVDAYLDAAISSRLAPTVSGRTLDVTPTGEAGIDWANIGGPTTTVNLSGTTIKDVTDVSATFSTVNTKLDTIETATSTYLDATVSSRLADADYVAADNTKIDELHKLQGLDISNPMTVTSTSRNVGTIALDITGDGVTTTTVTRTA